MKKEEDEKTRKTPYGVPMRRGKHDFLDFFDEMMDAFRSPWMMPSIRERMEMFPEPYIEMTETDKEVVLTAELPGVKKDNIKINITEDRMELGVDERGEKEKEAEGEYRYESRYYGMHHSYATPVKIDPDRTKASFKNGVLEIRAEKAEKTEKKRITVE